MEFLPRFYLAGLLVGGRAMGTPSRDDALRVALEKTREQNGLTREWIGRMESELAELRATNAQAAKCKPQQGEENSTIQRVNRAINKCRKKNDEMRLKLEMVRCSPS